MLEKYYSVRRWFLYELKYYPKYFREGVSNLWKWFPIIWMDRDWDSHFIYEVLKFKVGNTAKYIGDHNRHTTSKRDAEIMILTTKLIQRCQDEFYDGEYMDYHESAYNFIDINSEDNIPEHIALRSKKLEINEISNIYQEYFNKYPRIYKQIKSQHPNKLNGFIAMRMADENQNKFKKLLFKILENNIQKWWD